MTCRKCGELLDDNTKFCPVCGARQAPEEPAAESAVLNPVHQHQEDCVHEGYVGNPDSVSLPEAIRLFFTRYADFKGRSRRSEYWWVTLFNTVVGGIIGAVLPDFAWIWSLAIIVPTLALIARRLHDTGKSGWYYLWFLLPLAGPIIILIQFLKDSAPDNQWGPNPKY